MSVADKAKEFVGIGAEGVYIDAPDRIKSVARLIARQATPETQKAMAARVKKLHPQAVADKIIGRAREIVREGRGGQRKSREGA